MKKKMFDIVLWIITLFFIGSVFLMPETVPIHWDINWKVDGYGSRYYLIILALFPILVHYGMFFAKKIDPRKRNIEKREKKMCIRDSPNSFCFSINGNFKLRS